MPRRTGWLTLAAFVATMASALPAAAPGTTERIAARPQPWDRLIPASKRFKPALDGTAVLDRETGLVWELAPDTAPISWVAAPFVCLGKTVGGRKGWRLPAVEELMSLIEPAAAIPSLPPGHPFTGIQPDVYWTATSVAGVAGEAYGVSLADGSLFDQPKSTLSRFWCVRGGFGHDGM
ncbi:MAG TPA: DUF1566 domain-containing protein [Verrucomicrobiae bacterium]|nr:DUF1566 domain-containing protein [Verrucomicrobiae bacterium]